MSEELKAWKCNICADTEGGYAPCKFVNYLSDNTRPEFCPHSQDECEWEEDTTRTPDINTEMLSALKECRNELAAIYGKVGYSTVDNATDIIEAAREVEG